MLHEHSNENTEDGRNGKLELKNLGNLSNKVRDVKVDIKIHICEGQNECIHCLSQKTALHFVTYYMRTTQGVECNILRA